MCVYACIDAFSDKTKGFAEAKSSCFQRACLFHPDALVVIISGFCPLLLPSPFSFCDKARVSSLCK